MRYRYKDIQIPNLDDDSCLEWLKNQRFPQGIECPVCKKITKHHKVSKYPCYACDRCGHHVYPAAGTIFHKSTTPLKIWLEVIRKTLDSKQKYSIKDIQREYGLTYKTSWRMVNLIKKHFIESQSGWDTVLDKQGHTGNDRQITIAGMKLDKHLRTLESKTNEAISVPVDHHHSITAMSYISKKKNRQRKRDRTARLLKLQMLLCQYPKGLSVAQIATECDISQRTVYRDLEALDSEIGIPIWENNGMRGVADGYFLPPIHLTPKEAFIIFIAVRLMRNFIPEIGPVVTSTFFKLNTIVPPFLQKQVIETIKHLEHNVGKMGVIRNFNTIFDAWMSQRKIRVKYQDNEDDKPVERVIDTYFIEPSVMEPSMCWVIAFCHLKNAIRTIPITKIVGSITIEPETYDIPGNFNPIEYLDSVWGVPIDNHIEVVKLRFIPEASRYIVASPVLSPRITKRMGDGSVIVTLHVGDMFRFCNWLLGWKSGVEVLEPASLRNKIIEYAASISDRYR